jgi:hypothetical protein
MRLTKNQNFLDRLEGKKKCLLAMEQQEESLNLKIAHVLQNIAKTLYR